MACKTGFARCHMRVARTLQGGSGYPPLRGDEWRPIFLKSAMTSRIEYMRQVQGAPLAMMRGMAELRRCGAQRRDRVDGIARRRPARGRMGAWLEAFRWADQILADACNGGRDRAQFRADGDRVALIAVWHGLRGVDRHWRGRQHHRRHAALQRVDRSRATPLPHPDRCGHGRPEAQFAGLK